MKKLLKHVPTSVVNGYWMYKYRDVSNITYVMEAGALSPLQLKWNSYLSIASIIPNVIFVMLNAIIGHKFRTQPRIIFAIVVIMIAFIFADVMTITDTDAWQQEFLIGTLVSVVIINIMVAIFQGGLAGLAAQFPPEYMGSMCQGQALGGIFASGTNVVTLLLGGTGETSALWCFLIAIIFLGSSLAALVFLTRTEFFQHYVKDVPEPSTGEEEPLITPDHIDVSDPATRVCVIHVFKQIWIWMLAVFISFTATLSVFPAVTALTHSTGYEGGKGGRWSTEFFVPVTCFVFFNIGDYVGRILAGFILWPKATKYGGWTILAMSLARLVFIPLFLFCNASPANRVYTPILFPSDTTFIFLIILFSISNGYIGNIAMMYAPKVLPDGRSQSTAASMMVSALVIGLGFGSILSTLWVNLL
eukprot:maker-scaffold513_size150706-snap-gene-0.24 protein:Tk02892 transcript:maker-scaffold513_size150706-snap-gene-0.24-mRNA-1 annotation:"equilibrative nucleoside transporter 3"